MSRGRYLYYAVVGVTCAILQWTCAALLFLLVILTFAAAMSGWHLGILEVVLVKAAEILGIWIAWFVFSRLFMLFAGLRAHFRVRRGLKAEWERENIGGRVVITDRVPNLIAMYVIGMAITGFALFSTFTTARSYFVSNSWGYFVATSDPQCTSFEPKCVSTGDFVSDNGKYRLTNVDVEGHKVPYGGQLRMNYDPREHDKVHPLTTSGPPWWPMVITIPVALYGVPRMALFTYRAIRNFWRRTTPGRTSNLPSAIRARGRNW